MLFSTATNTNKYFLKRVLAKTIFFFGGGEMMYCNAYDAIIWRHTIKDHSSDDKTHTLGIPFTLLTTVNHS